MRLDGREGQSLALAIVGYQFADHQSNEYDANWLRIAIEVTHPRGTWRSIDPSLLTWEVAELANWLDALAVGQGVDEELGFIEPNLRFVTVHKGATPRLRVFFELESRPSWARETSAPAEDLWIDLSLDPALLHEAAADLRGQLVRYPLRDPVPSRRGPTIA